MVAQRVKTASENRELFGGSIKAKIPEEFEDISVIREIPDNQEVYTHGATDRSVIIELLEQQALSANTTPASFHISNLAEESGALQATTHQVTELPSRDFPNLLQDDARLSVSLAQATHIVSKFRDAPELASHVLVHLACVRLPRATTDMLVVLNDPVHLHPNGSSARAGSTVAGTADIPREQVLQNILQSLRIHDWGLLE